MSSENHKQVWFELGHRRGGKLGALKKPQVFLLSVEPVEPSFDGRAQALKASLMARCDSFGQFFEDMDMEGSKSFFSHQAL